jgi:hypothetical protein
MAVAACAVLACIPAPAQVKVTQAPNRISVEIGGRPYTTLFFGPNTTKPYLHPLRAASGTIVTRLYPMEHGEGETLDHPHHRGLWFAHGDVNGLDFWGNEPGQSSHPGRIVLKKVLGVESGPKSGQVRVLFDWVDGAGKPLLEEARTMVFYSDPTLRTIDFDIRLKAIERVTFGDTKEGTFAIRLAPWLEEPAKDQPTVPRRTGKMINAEGAVGEPNIWGKRSDWVDHYGETGGETIGVAIFDHPSNPRHPAYWHSRAYGLFAVNIFGLHDFQPNQKKDGSLTLAPGGVLRFRYRVIVHPGDPVAARIAERYAEYAGTK